MLTIIQVGDNEASNRYVRNKMVAIKKAELESNLVKLPERATTEDVLNIINDSSYVSTAIMVQLPLPDHIDKKRVLEAIPLSKDIDGLNPKSDYEPLTPCAIIRWLKENNIQIEGKLVTVFGRSDLVGKPLVKMFIEEGATVTSCNSHTPQYAIEDLMEQSDIVVSAVGKPEFVNVCGGNCEGQVFIDVGINRDAEGNLCGDIHKEIYEYLNANGGICTPVPGGVGKWTVQELVYRLKQMENDGLYDKAVNYICSRIALDGDCKMDDCDTCVANYMETHDYTIADLAKLYDEL